MEHFKYCFNFHLCSKQFGQVMDELLLTEDHKMLLNDSVALDAAC